MLKVLLDLVVVVDEVYVDFGGESVIVLVDCYLNLLVIQMLFKLCFLVGLWVGLVVGYVDLVEVLEWIKNSFNFYLLDCLVIVGVVVVFEDDVYFCWICQVVIDSCEVLSVFLQVLGFEVLLLVVNFVFVCYLWYDVGQIVLILCEQGVIVCYFKQVWIDQFLCIIIGSLEQNQVLLDVLYFFK